MQLRYILYVYLTLSLFQDTFAVTNRCVPFLSFTLKCNPLQRDTSYNSPTPICLLLMNY